MPRALYLHRCAAGARGSARWWLLMAMAAPAVLATASLFCAQVGSGPAATPPPTVTAAASALPAAPSAPKPVSGPAEEPLLSPPQWARLQASLADRPGRDAELARILELLDYQRDVRRLAVLRETAAPADDSLRELARRLDAGLSLRLARGEISGPEAQRLKGSLLEVLQPDPAQRPKDLIAWRETQWRGHQATLDPRNDRWLAAQQALVADWRARAPEDSSPDELVQALQALRLRIYDTPP